MIHCNGTVDRIMLRVVGITKATTKIESNPKSDKTTMYERRLIWQLSDQVLRRASRTLIACSSAKEAQCDLQYIKYGKFNLFDHLNSLNLL